MKTTQTVSTNNSATINKIIDTLRSSLVEQARTEVLGEILAKVQGGASISTLLGQSKLKVGRKLGQKIANVNGMNKTQFIQAQPLEMKAVEIVEAAAKVGLDLTTQYVYIVRSKMSAVAADPNTPKRGRGRPRKTPVVSTEVPAEVPAEVPVEEVPVEAPVDSPAEVSADEMLVVDGLVKKAKKAKKSKKADVEAAIEV